MTEDWSTSNANLSLSLIFLLLKLIFQLHFMNETSHLPLVASAQDRKVNVLFFKMGWHKSKHIQQRKEAILSAFLAR